MINYSPKLKEAMAEINAVLERHDIAAHVVLHEPGFSEYLWRIDPSWSVIRFGVESSSVTGFRFRSKLEDYGGDKDLQKREQDASINMIVHFKDMLQRDGVIARNIEEVLKNHIDFEYGESVHTPHRLV